MEGKTVKKKPQKPQKTTQLKTNKLLPCCNYVLSHIYTAVCTTPVKCDYQLASTNTSQAGKHPYVGELHHTA